MIHILKTPIQIAVNATFGDSISVEESVQHLRDVSHWSLPVPDNVRIDIIKRAVNISRTKKDCFLLYLVTVQRLKVILVIFHRNGFINRCLVVKKFYDHGWYFLLYQITCRTVFAVVYLSVTYKHHLQLDFRSGGN